ncbi:MAG: VOC family protein [Candidatus Abawacabacteria bacterium]|nr:VOC family protein [Candidatus Abawacabacteria bacterium]
MAKLYRVIVPVTDIEVAAQFYGQVLETPGERVSPGRHYFHCDGTVLACYDPARDGDQLSYGWQMHENQYLYFAVEDLSKVRGLLKKAGASALGKVQAMPWGETLLYAKDPFGNPISFVDSKTVFTGTSKSSKK